ncbi:MAG: response regulator transcription factor [Pseudohongiellaceae bacterium]
MRILIVEDETRLVEVVTENLQKSGFVVDAVTTGIQACNAMQTVSYDAVVLDLGLPDCNGIEVLCRIRDLGFHVPVLILTARDAVEDRVNGLDSGADDYLVKPFATLELVSRLKALLRRPGGVLGSILVAGNLTLDTIARDIQINQAPVELSRREVAVLEHLMRRLGRVVPKELLEEKLYGFGEELESNAVPVHVHHLRRKLEQGGASAQIHTVRGVGYLLAEER